MLNKFKVIGASLMILSILMIAYAITPGSFLSITSTGMSTLNGEQITVKWAVDSSAGYSSVFDNTPMCPYGYNYVADVILSKPDGSKVTSTINPSGIGGSGVAYLFDYTFSPQKVGTYNIDFEGKCVLLGGGSSVYKGVFHESKSFTFNCLDVPFDPSCQQSTSGSSSGSSGTSNPTPTPTPECTSSQQPYCDGSTAVQKKCDDGKWIIINQVCEYGCNGGACEQKPIEKAINSTLNTSSNSSSANVNTSNSSVSLTGNKIYTQQQFDEALKQYELKNNPTNYASFSTKVWLEQEDLLTGVKNMTVLMSGTLFLVGLFLFSKRR